jgi:hypothetical protein
MRGTGRLGQRHFAVNKQITGITSHGMTVLVIPTLACPCITEEGLFDPSDIHCRGTGRWPQTSLQYQTTLGLLLERSKRDYHEPGSWIAGDILCLTPPGVELGDRDFVRALDRRETFTDEVLQRGVRDTVRFTGGVVLLQVRDFTRTYSAGTDFALTPPNLVTWLPGGQAPPAGGYYALRYQAFPEFLVFLDNPRLRVEGHAAQSQEVVLRRLDAIFPEGFRPLEIPLSAVIGEGGGGGGIIGGTLQTAIEVRTNAGLLPATGGAQATVLVTLGATGGGSLQGAAGVVNATAVPGIGGTQGSALVSVGTMATGGMQAVPASMVMSAAMVAGAGTAQGAAGVEGLPPLPGVFLFAGAPKTTTALEPTSIATGADMAGMEVTVLFEGGTSETVVWIATGPTAGGAFGTGWQLTEDGDTGFADFFGGLGFWALNNASALPIQRIFLNAGLGDCVFDINFGVGGTEEGTPDSGQGITFEIIFSSSGVSLSTDVRVNYRDYVTIGAAAPVGDLFCEMEIDFLDPVTRIGPGGGFLFFVADTDRIAIPGDLQPV